MNVLVEALLLCGSLQAKPQKQTLVQHVYTLIVTELTYNSTLSTVYVMMSTVVSNMLVNFAIKAVNYQGIPSHPGIGIVLVLLNKEEIHDICFK